MLFVINTIAKRKIKHKHIPQGFCFLFFKKPVLWTQSYNNMSYKSIVLMYTIKQIVFLVDWCTKFEFL